jgi:hypothetical protein
MAGTRTEVEQFLKELKEKLKVWGILYLDQRGKSQQTLQDLEITPKERTSTIEELEMTDYVDGPLDEKLHGLSEMWVFGKHVKSREIYIKISLGIRNSNVICISFHISEYPLRYPFKKQSA